MPKYYRSLIPALTVVLLLTGKLAADDKKADTTVKLAEGKVTLESPKEWTRKQPRVRILDAEFAIKAVGDDKIDARATIMGAGGSIQANIKRWEGQFPKLGKKKVEKKKIADQEVHIVDFTGTFKDQRGPFSPATIRDDYRMLAAIIVTEKTGQYFVKFYGPKGTVTKHEKAFMKMIESVKVKK